MTAASARRRPRIDVGSARPEVLVLTPDFPPDVGGIQTVISRIVAGLTGFRPRVVTTAAPGGLEFDRSQPFDVCRVPAGRDHRLDIASLNTFAVLNGLRRRPSVILSAHIAVGPAAVTLRRALRRPLLQYTHAQELVRRPALARWVLRHADAVVAVSSYGRTLVDRVAGPCGPVHVIHPGVESASAPPVLEMNRSSIAVVARLTERYKGHDILLQSLPLVRDRVSDANLQIIGDGPLRNELQDLARRLGVDGAATFHGSVSTVDRDALLRASTVFAMPSRTDPDGAGEGFGIAYLEAGAVGLPVVAGDVGGALDAVIDGETGLLVDPENPRAVANALTALLRDTTRAQRMGHAGWKHARSLPWERAASEVESLLSELVSG